MEGKGSLNERAFVGRQPRMVIERCRVCRKRGDGHYLWTVQSRTKKKKGSHFKATAQKQTTRGGPLTSQLKRPGGRSGSFSYAEKEGAKKRFESGGVHIMGDPPVLERVCTFG